MGFGAFVFCVKFYTAYRASVSLVVFMRVTYRVKGLLKAFSAFGLWSRTTGVFRAKDLLTFANFGHMWCGICFPKFGGS